MVTLNRNFRQMKIVLLSEDPHNDHKRKCQKKMSGTWCGAMCTEFREPVKIATPILLWIRKQAKKKNTLNSSSLLLISLEVSDKAFWTECVPAIEHLRILVRLEADHAMKQILQIASFWNIWHFYFCSYFLSSTTFTPPVSNRNSLRSHIHVFLSFFFVEDSIICHIWNKHAKEARNHLTLMSLLFLLQGTFLSIPHRL